MSRAEYRRPRPTVRLGDTRPSRSYARSVCGCRPDSCAATEMTNTGVSSSNMASLLSGRQVGARILIGSRRPVGLECLLRLIGNVGGDGDLDGDEEIALGAVTTGSPLAAHAQHA